MATEVDLKLGMNIEIGSVPISLDVEIDKKPEETTYTFDGCIQDYDIPLKEFISYVGQQFGVDVELPPEIALDAKIDYLVGQVIQSKPAQGKATTELGAAGKFTLTVSEDKKYTLTFYADTYFGKKTKENGNPYVIGAAIDMNLDFAELPLVGKIPGFNDLTLTNVGFSYTNTSPGNNDGKDVQFHIPGVKSSSNPLYTRNEKDAKNSKTYEITKDGDKRNFSLNKKGFALTAGFVNKQSSDVMNNFALPMNLPEKTPPATNPPPTPIYDGKTSPPASPIHWIDINKTFGPVTLQQIGLNYSKGDATFGFSAGFQMAAFSLDLQQLAITFPMPLPGQPAGSKVGFDLAGLAMDIKTGGFEIGGAFLRARNNDVDSYYGEVMVQISDFGFKALGGYTPEHESEDSTHPGKKITIPASFFLYVNIEVPIGGPPYLFVNGIAGGFGINNSLRLPDLEQLPGFILFPGNAPAAEGSSKDTIKKVLPQMQKYFVNEPGQYWIAAGVQISSFEMINAFVLVVPSFGVDFQISVLGSASMNFPKGSPDPVAFIEIDVKASFLPSVGQLSVEGIISPASYLFGSYVQLTGGFAFYIWFSGVHEGDFVVTVGGYNPSYKKPAHYPVVPRLGINFALGPFHVTGASYFALTPAMFMAGFSLDAEWKTANIKAYFRIGADFLIAWAPFHYNAEVYVLLGCSVDLGLFTLNVHIGADLAIWGPAFGGRAEIDLDIVSFTIEFGAEENPPAPVGWKSFQSGFLPGGEKTQSRVRSAMPAPVMGMALNANAPGAANEDEEASNVTASVKRGLLKSDVDGIDWIIDPGTFIFLVRSVIPVNDPKWAMSDDSSVDISNNKSDYNKLPVDVSKGPYSILGTDEETFSDTLVWNPTVSIRPMKINKARSELDITLSKRGDGDAPGTYSEYVKTVSVEPILLDSTAALWKEAPEKSDPNEESFVKHSLVGFGISPIPRTPSRVDPVPLLELLFQEGNDVDFTYTSKKVDGNFTVTSQSPAPQILDITVSGGFSAKMENKDYLLGSLINDQVSSGRNAMLEGLIAAGFSTCAPDEVNLTVLATKYALTDWPEVMLLGAKL